jgi:hypothetical protein
MNILYIIALILGSLVILVLVAFVFMRGTTEHRDLVILEVKDKKTAEHEPKIPHDFESLRKIIKNKKSSAKQLEEALELILKYYGDIHPKLGIRTHPDFDNYMDVIIRLCRHPRATSKMVVSFDKELRKKNPDYEKDINDAITKGLNSRV